MFLRCTTSNSRVCNVPYVRTAFSSRAFRHAAPAVCNGLPSEITDTALSLETFKSRLKTYLFNQSFSCWSCYWSASEIRRLCTTTYDALRTVYYYHYHYYYDWNSIFLYFLQLVKLAIFNVHHRLHNSYTTFGLPTQSGLVPVLSKNLNRTSCISLCHKIYSVTGNLLQRSNEDTLTIA